MPFLIGTDEAGYGPNLGPLVIGATFWQHRDRKTNLYDSLAEAVSFEPDSSTEQLLIADSKVAYRSQQSIKTLETSVLSLTKLAFGELPATLSRLVELVCGHGAWQSLCTAPWLLNADLKLPLESDNKQIEKHVRHLDRVATNCGIGLNRIHCRLIFPEQFNQLVATLGNKANLLSQQTLQLVADLLPETTSDHVDVVCDKHGGRSQYAGMVQHYLTDQMVLVNAEGRSQSEYQFREHERDVVVRFVAGGEKFLPAAAASMFAKYLRELFMELWNRFWISHDQALRPTKGYPQDAKRFLRDIRPVQQRLKISDESIWRCR